MRFAKAFLDAPDTLSYDDAIARQVAFLLEAVVPGPQLPAGCAQVAASNLGFALPMNWALADAERREEIGAALRERLLRFEPRLVAISEIAISEDDEGNIVEFFIHARRADAGGVVPVEIGARLSLLDNGVEEAGS